MIGLRRFENAESRPSRRVRRRGVLFAAALLMVSGAVSLAETVRERRVYVAELKGAVNPGVAAHLRQAIDQASRDEQAEAVLIRMDTPGGLLTSTRDIIQAMSGSRVPVLIFVGPSGASATSAGAILLVAAHGAGMAPGTNVGAAHPVGPQGENVPGDMREKAVNDTVAMVKSMAEQRHRPVDVAEKMVRSSASFTSREALEKNLIDVVANDEADFLKALDGKKIPVEGAGREITLRLSAPVLLAVKMTWGQRLLHFLADPNVATLLLSLGSLLIYVEITNPGITIAGVLGGICLIAGLMSFQLLPIRTGGLLLLVLGLVMMIVEAFTPTFGALAIGGLISVVLGFLWVMDPSGGALQISPAVWVPVLVVFAATGLLIGLAARRSKRLVEQALRQMKGVGVGGLAGYSGVVDFVDATDPTRGTAVFRGEIWKVQSSSSTLVVGGRVRVEKVEGLTARVAPEEVMEAESSNDSQKGNS